MRNVILAFLPLFFSSASAIAQENSYAKKSSIFDGIETEYEMQVSASNGNTPLWLNANKYGLSSVKSSNGFVRGAIKRDIRNDDSKKWGVGYGLDLAVAYNYQSSVMLQQAYLEGRYKRGSLTIGSKYQKMELKNQRLSSGAQALGINARPIPQVRLALEDYWTIPGLKKWISIKGHIAYGIMTDGCWQKEFTQKQSKWTENALYHSKAGFLKIGKDERPFSVELGLEMAAIFGGTVNWFDNNGKLVTFKGGTKLKNFWHAFIPGGSDFEEEEKGYVNIEGNHLGSWLARFSYQFNSIGISLYADHYFEDHSALYHLGNYGYGKDGDWQKRSSKFYLYPLKDGLLGMELNFKRCSFVRNVVVEFINTRYQSGPIYHDHSETIFDQIGGQDNYYNHEYYPGWQYYGQVIGNPLYLSPIYNKENSLYNKEYLLDNKENLHYNKENLLTIKNNRFFAWHFGLDGNIISDLSYRILASWQKGLGTYRNPYNKPKKNFSLLAELSYNCEKWLDGLELHLSYGQDKGEILGNNNGVQFSVIFRR